MREREENGGERVGKGEREREREKWSHWDTLPRTTQVRKSKPTIQISCESKLGPAQRPYVGDAQMQIINPYPKK